MTRVVESLTQRRVKETAAGASPRREASKGRTEKSAPSSAKSSFPYFDRRRPSKIVRSEGDEVRGDDIATEKSDKRKGLHGGTRPALRTHGPTHCSPRTVIALPGFTTRSDELKALGSLSTSSLRAAYRRRKMVRNKRKTRRYKPIHSRRGWRGEDGVDAEMQGPVITGRWTGSCSRRF